MNIHRKLTLAALAATVLAVLVPGARAQGSEEVKVTFSKPVELPGEVLPAGTYIFAALENGSLTRVLSPDNQHVWATLLTVPVERAEPADKPTVVLGEGAKNAPPRVEEWFYPGNSIGSEFRYPKSHSKKDVASIIKTSGKDAAHDAGKNGHDYRSLFKVSGFPYRPCP